MSAAGSITELQQALQALHGASTSSSDKSAANAYLLRFQRSVAAWDIIFPVLTATNDNYNPEIRIFVAQTLRSKVQYDFGQLNEDPAMLGQLRASILNLLSSTTDFKHNKLIIVQLAVSLAYLVIQDFSWTNPLADVIGVLSANPTNLLEFLKVLPEELSDFKKLPLSIEEFEAQYKKIMVDNAENVYYLLLQVSESFGAVSDATSVNVLLIDCIKSWINEIPAQLILGGNLALWNKITAGFMSDDTFDAAVESLISIIASIDVFDKISENAKYVELIYNHLITLKPAIKENWDDPGVIERLTELYSTTGESWHLLIVKNPSDFQVLIETIVELTNYNEDLDIVKYTFKFWYEVKSMLVLSNFKASRELFKPVYVQLVDILIRHLKYPTTSTSTNISELFDNNKEEEDKFKDFRYEIGDVLKDCCLVLGHYDALNIPFTALQRIIQQTQGSGTWQDIECLLFSIRAMAKEVPKSENAIIPQIMNYLVQLPENPKVRYAATLVLGRYTVWTSAHPEFLSIELNYIIEGFKVQAAAGWSDAEKMDVVIATSHALKYFCIDCSELLVDHVEALYNLYAEIEGKIDFKSLYDIVEGLSHVLKQIIDKNIISNEEQCMGLLKMFLSSTLQKLAGFVESGNVDETTVADTIEVLTLFIENIRVPDEVLELRLTTFKVCDYLMSEVFALVYRIVEKYGSSMKISERCVKFMRKNMQNFKRFLIPCLKEMEAFLAFGFKNFRSGCYLWCSGALIKEFSVDDEEYEAEEVIHLDKQTLDEVWAFCVQQIESFISIYKEVGDRIDVELVEDFYRMMNDVLMFKTLEMLNNFEIVEMLFAISIEFCRNVSEFSILKLVVEFMIDLFSWCQENPPVSIFFEIPAILKTKLYSLISSNEETLLMNFLDASIVKYNEDLVYLSIELIIQVLKVNGEFGEAGKGLIFIEKFLGTLPNELLSSSEKVRFLNNFQKAMEENNLRKMRSNLLDFIHWYKRKIINRD